jgi:hemerythrin-like domain-containing protein
VLTLTIINYFKLDQRTINKELQICTVDPIKIMQEHNWVVDFLKHDFEKIYNSVHKQDQQQLQQIAKNEINKFLINLRNHFLEEEQIVFPLALRASAANSS